MWGGPFRRDRIDADKCSDDTCIFMRVYVPLHYMITNAKIKMSLLYKLAPDLFDSI